MRFGIMAMQIDSLIPPEARDLPPEQALMRVMSFDHAGLVRSLAQQGFNPIELGGDLAMLLPHTYAPPAIESLKALKAELGLSYTVHLPLWSVEPSTLQTPVRQGSVQALVNMIRLTQPLEPEVYVMHATGALAAEFYRMRLPEMAREVLLRQFQNGARQSLQSILAQTGLPSRRLAIETIEFPFELTLELAEEMDLSICFDTGHVLVGFSGPVDFFEALERSLPRLGEIHLHDGPWQGPERNIGYGKDHSPLGTGDLDVPRLLDRLEKAQFKGPIIFELRLEEALASMQVIRSLRPAAARF
ncbi:MAG: sugar phosphate isomerase/epimerase [Anaerolineales bacterium]|nr:sugar phosphate isomerase/epimerase [Anaerolineales bacterium]